ncbi:MAG TPA: ATPase domain-containing protein [Vicinamibacterales bacterium]|nr:ATPase domain-containing protein [Vicinamibacterales bacterium]
MGNTGHVAITRLSSGVQKLDDILGGGWPEYSFNLIVGEPGCGKTTLAHQFMFANATAEHPALYFTVLGEPTIKMLRYQQQFSFFEMGKVGTAIHFVNLTEEALGNDLGKVFDAIVAKIEELSPRIIIVDSFRPLVGTPGADGMSLQEFVQRLAMHLTSWQATTFLLGEYPESQLREHPAFTMADGLLLMRQQIIRNSMVRQVQVVKMRGNSPQPGLHTIRISEDGVRAFPRMLKPIEEVQRAVTGEIISMGISGLDDMMGGGTLRGNAVLIAGPAGSGKTVTAIHFLAEGVKRGEHGVLVMFEETVPKYLHQAKSLGFDLEQMQKDGMLDLIYVRPLDLSMDETLYAIEAAVDGSDAKRVVLDSLSGLEAALAPTFKDDFLESLYRLLGALTGVGITILLTVEVSEPYSDMKFSPHPISYLTHDVVLQRFYETEGELCSLMTVIKTRARQHSHDLRSYRITSSGIVVGERLTGYTGLITSVPDHLRTKR